MRRLAALLTLLTLALSGAGCATDRQVIAQASDAHQQLEPAVITDAQLSGYLQAMGRRVVDAARELDAKGFGPDSNRKEDDSWMFSKDMAFHFVNSETLNAFTTGGNHMYIYT